jgi:two-component system, OmpR family, response regulator RegX3
VTTHLLIVDDEPSYRDALSSALRNEGFGVDVAADGVEALERFDAHPPDLVLLDVMLPRLSGVDVCRRIRERSRVPIIMLTARDSEVDTVVGLEVGADDYVAKPFRVRELVARIRAVMRRAEQRGAGGSPTLAPGDAITIGDVSLDPARHEVRVGGELVHLPRKEFELLEILMLNAGFVVTRDTLIDQVWGADYVGDTKTLDVHVKRVRAKIERDADSPRRLATVRGVGYRFEGV